MIKKIATHLTAPLFLLLTGCATQNLYQQPLKKEASVAIIQGTMKRYSLFDWKLAEISSIDEKEVIPSFISQTPKIRILPGHHTIVTHASFNKALFGSGPYEALIEIPVNIQAGQHYTIHIDPKGARVFAWVEDREGKKISPISSQPYQRIKVQYSGGVTVIHRK